MRKLLETYLQYRRSLKQSPRTVEESYYEINMFLKFFEERNIQNCNDVRREHIQDYQAYLSEKKIKGLPYTPETLNKKIKEARSFLRFLAERGHIIKSFVEILKSVRTPRRLPLGVFDHGQISKVLQNISTGDPLPYRDRTMLEILYSSGIRASELAGLDITDIDFRNSTLKVFGKGSKERIVPMGKTAVRYLETYVKAVRPFLIASPNEKALFVNAKGIRIQRHTVTRIVHRHCDNQDFDTNVTAHTFRRSCATELIKADANIYHVKDFLGHESLDTLKRYINLAGVEVKKMHSQCHPRERDEDSDFLIRGKRGCMVFSHRTMPVRASCRPFATPCQGR